MNLTTAALVIMALGICGCEKPVASNVTNEAVAAKLTQEQVQKLLTEAMAELDQKNFGKSVEITMRISKSDPGNTESYMIESQAKSMSGDVTAAMNALDKAFKNGFKDIERVMTEQRLDAVRAMPAFQDLLRKYGFTSAPTITTSEIKAGDVSIKEENGMQVIQAGDVLLRAPKN